MTKIKDDQTDLSDYWQLGMHDNENGEITSIVFSFDKKFLFTCGCDGNLFQYEVRIEGEEVGIVTCKSWIPIEGIIDDDVADEDLISSEEEKRKTNDDQRQTICDANKRKVLNVLEECRKRFQRIWDKNESLAEWQRMNEDAFELDRRITEDLKETMDRKTKTAQREMEYDVERARLGVKKMKAYFIDSLDSIPIQVLAIRSNGSVQSLRVRKLGDEFHRSREELQRRMTQFKEESR